MGSSTQLELVKARDAYEQTPRDIDGDLVRKARGDRGCLGDSISGFGALSTVVCGLLASFGILPLGFAFIGVAILVVGFVVGAVGQSKSGKERTKALEEGPLVSGYVVRVDEHLRTAGRRSGRATVLFTTDRDVRFDEKFLRKAARRIRHRLDQDATQASTPWAKLMNGTETFGFESVPDGLGDGHPLWLADVVVYPENLEDERVGGDPKTGEGAVLPVIVDTSAKFVEHVWGSEAAADDADDADDAS